MPSAINLLLSFPFFFVYEKLIRKPFYSLRRCLLIGLLNVALHSSVITAMNGLQLVR